jgi:hypothetical protein
MSRQDWKTFCLISGVPNLRGCSPSKKARALTTTLEAASPDLDTAGLDAFIQCALSDVRAQRTRGVRGGSAYVLIAEPRLRRVGLVGAYFSQRNA